jgi:hypothetical protein
MAVIKIKIFVPEIANVLSQFDSIQVQRSEAGSPYNDALFITADIAEAPAVTGSLEGPFTIQGRDLRLKVNGGAEQTVTFLSADPISIDNVISEVNSGTTGLVASSDGGKLRLTGDVSGTAGTVEITGGTALNALGFSVGQKDNGEDQHITLVSGVSEYQYDDASGAASYWYRTRFYNSSTKTYSSWSDWVKGDTGAAIDASLLIVGKIKLSDIDGTAVVGGHVTITSVWSPLMADGYFVSGKTKQIETDGTGYAELTLIKGSKVDVMIDGTSFVRRIQVPTTGTEFDLMDPSLQLDDPFQIKVPDLPAAVRRS